MPPAITGFRRHNRHKFDTPELLELEWQAGFETVARSILPDARNMAEVPAAAPASWAMRIRCCTPCSVNYRAQRIEVRESILFVLMQLGD